MLTGYTFCILLKTNTASEVVQPHIDQVCTKLGGSMKILSDNGENSKINCLQMWLPNWVWNIKFIPLLTIPYPMEKLKDYIISSKHACLNMYQNLLSETRLYCWLALHIIFLPNEHSKGSPFFLMFG